MILIRVLTSDGRQAYTMNLLPKVQAARCNLHILNVNRRKVANDIQILALVFDKVGKDGCG